MDSYSRKALLRLLNRSNQFLLKSIKKLSVDDNDDIESYVLADSCQIPKLADLYKLFIGYKTDGYFVEFGAYDGEYVSNASGLADLGWGGLYIEPVQEYFQKAVDRHKSNNKVSVVNCAVGESNCKIDISVAGVLSSISKDAVDKFNSMGWSKGFHKGHFQVVEQRKLGDILAEYNAPKGFDVLSVDVEGYEWNALENFKLSEWSPKVVIVELHDNNVLYDVEWDNCNALVEYFEKNGIASSRLCSSAT